MAATIKASKLFPDPNFLKTNRCHKHVYNSLVCVTKHAAKSQTRRLELCIVVSAKTVAVFLEQISTLSNLAWSLNWLIILTHISKSPETTYLTFRLQLKLMDLELPHVLKGPKNTWLDVWSPTRDVRHLFHLKGWIPQLCVFFYTLWKVEQGEQVADGLIRDERLTFMLVSLY